MRRKFALSERAAALESSSAEQVAAIVGLENGAAELGGRVSANEAGLSGVGSAQTSLASQVARNKEDVDAALASLSGQVGAIDIPGYVEPRLAELVPEHPLLPAFIEVVTAVDFALSTVTKKRLVLDTRGRITAIEEVV